MNEPITIPRIKYGDPGPGWIRRSQSQVGVPGQPHKFFKPMIVCKCGKICGIGLHHVHADGTVTASFFHSTEKSFVHNGKTYEHEPGCGWHVFLKLDSYTDGEFLPEP